MNKEIEHREFLVKLYEEDVKGGIPFEKAVAEQALRYLKHTNVKPKKIEKWVCDITRKFRTALT